MRLRHGVGLMLLVLLTAATGCNRRRVDDTPALRPEVDGPIGVRIAAVEKTLEAKGFTLPSAVKGLIRDLREHRKAFTGDVDALDAIVRKLENWHARSNTRKTADTDADRAELKCILEELKPMLKTAPAPTPSP